jgi:hypothetical protein
MLIMSEDARSERPQVAAIGCFCMNVQDSLCRPGSGDVRRPPIALPDGYSPRTVVESCERTFCGCETGAMRQDAGVNHQEFIR